MAFLDRFTKIGKIGLLLFIIGTVVFVVGFSVPYWLMVKNGHQHIGLWENCADIGSTTVCSSVFDTGAFGDRPGTIASWFRGTQALACLALIAIILDFALKFLFMCGKPKTFLLISFILDIVAAVLAFLAAVVFGSEISGYLYQLHFGFAFDIIGGIFFVGAAVCFIVEYIRR